MITRFVVLAVALSGFFWSPVLQSAQADMPATDLARSFSGMVTACDAIISQADIDGAAHDHGLTLSSAARAVDTREGANPNTGISAFFGPDTQIRTANNRTSAGLALFVVAADGSKCETLAFGGADLASALVEGLTAGGGGWRPIRDEPAAPPAHLDHVTEARRPNGDSLLLSTTAREGGVEIVDAKFVRGAAN
jgi:hypothetical protein